MFTKFLNLLMFVLTCLFAVPASHAHPMGNFSVNHYSRITLTKDAIEIRYLLDLAEIPTYQELQKGGIVAQAEDPRVKSFMTEQGEEFSRGLSLIVNGNRMPFKLISAEVIFPSGASGLPTMKMGFSYRVAYPATSTRTDSHLAFEDKNFSGHAGWKEIVVIAPDGTLIQSSVPTTDRSDELSNYPTDLLNGPPQNLSASLQFRFPDVAPSPAELQHPRELKKNPPQHGMRSDITGGPSVEAASNQSHSVAARIKNATSDDEQSTHQSVRSIKALTTELNANQQQTPRSAFTELITAGHLSLWFLMTAACIAFSLGALHALEPGHGKTIVAAYLVGSRGTIRHAMYLGVIVTASHTAGVFALGAITLYASRYIIPEKLYPWLGVFSGLMITGVGGYALFRRLAGKDGDHSHDDGLPHNHWFSSADERRGQGDYALPISEKRGGKKDVSLYQLFILGITGGMVPCPAALVVLLSAISLHRVGFGLFLIVAFSLGLAAVLIGVGTVMVYARQFVTGINVDGPLMRRWVPIASVAFMTVLGAGITLQALTSSLHLQTFSKSELGPFLFVAGVGLLLGIRHSTDPDHVVAVSTIVAKQGSIRHAALIGTFWGLGHTLTIFVVGGLIILCGVVIPPRLGLAMEFSVGMMLILLGGLNLTGLMQKISGGLTRILRPGAQSSRSRQLGAIAKKDRPESILRSLSGYQWIRPLAIGIVHGLAGSAAVALLVLSTIHSPMWATVYLVIFGAGTMIGMTFMTTAMAVPLLYAGDRMSKTSRYLGAASGFASLCFGFFLVYQLGYVGGLFSTHPHWIPR